MCLRHTASRESRRQRCAPQRERLLGHGRRLVAVDAAERHVHEDGRAAHDRAAVGQAARSAAGRASRAGRVSAGRCRVLRRQARDVIEHVVDVIEDRSPHLGVGLRPARSARIDVRLPHVRRVGEVRIRIRVMLIVRRQ
jgi:hypothetical protein